MRHIIYIAVSALCLIAQSMYAQGLFAKKAMEHEERNHFVDASEAYQGLFERGSREASLQAARNLYKGRRYEEALKLYEHADSLGIITDADEVFRFFECLKSVKRYGDADNLVKARIKDFQNRPEFGLHEDKVNYYNKLTSYKGVELTAQRKFANNYTWQLSYLWSQLDGNYEGAYQGDGETIAVDPSTGRRSGAADPRKADSKALGY